MTTETTGRTLYRNAVTFGAPLYWWHASIIDELESHRSGEYGRAAYNIHGIASNLRMSVADVAKYVDQLLPYGCLVECEPLWEMPADFRTRWVQIP